MHRTPLITLVAAAGVIASACSDAPRLTSPSAARPSFATEAADPSHIHQRNVRRGGHIWSIAAVDNAQSGKPPAAFYVFKDGQIQSVTSVVYNRSNGVWVRNRARTTLFINGRPAHQVTLDANGHRVASASRVGATLVALFKLALPDALAAQTAGGDPILDQENLNNAESQYQSDSASCSAGDQSACNALSSDAAAVDLASATLQSSLASGDYSTSDSSGDFYDTIDAFIASAGSQYCTDSYCIYLAS